MFGHSGCLECGVAMTVLGDRGNTHWWLPVVVVVGRWPLAVGRNGGCLVVGIRTGEHEMEVSLSPKCSIGHK